MALKCILLFLYHGLSFYILEKRKKNRGSPDQLSFSRAKFNPTPTSFEDNLIQNVTGCIFSHYIIPYYLYKAILHYKAKKEKEKTKQFVISAHPGIDPGPLVPKSDKLSNRPRCRVVRGSK